MRTPVSVVSVKMSPPEEVQVMVEPAGAGEDEGDEATLGDDHAELAGDVQGRLVFA